MALESATYIDGLNASNPAASDAINTADDHLRLIKSAIKATFPNITGPVTKTHAEINGLAPLASPTFTGTPAAPTPATEDSSTKIATTAFVANKIAAVSGGVTSFSGGSTGLTPSGATSGAVTLAGTLALANGGTGASTAANARTNLGVPSTTGTGASGNWGINITGSADSVSATGISNQFGSSKSSSGFQRLPSGVIIQWGSFTASAGTTNITFPTSFSSACYNVQVTTEGLSGGGVGAAHAVMSFNTSGATLSTNNGRQGWWVAIGS